MALLPNEMLETVWMTEVVNERPSEEAIRQQYAALELLPWEDFPLRTTINDIMYSENNLAGVYSPEGQALPLGRLQFGQELTNVIDVKAAEQLAPWAALQMREAGDPQVWDVSMTMRSERQRIENHISDLTDLCNSRVDAQIEYLGIKALSEGQIVWPPVDNNGAAITPAMPHWNATMSLTFQFPIPANQIQPASTLTGYEGATGGGFAWTNTANANPIRDIKVINQFMLKTKGVNMRGGTLLMSQITLDNMAEIAAIRDILLGDDNSQTGARDFIDDEMIQNFIRTKTGYNIRTYDAQWTHRANVPHTKPAITRYDFMRPGRVVFLPPGGPVGTMMNAKLEDPDRNWVNRKMGWSKRFDEPPFPQKLGVDATAWPKFRHYDWFILRAHD